MSTASSFGRGARGAGSLLFVALLVASGWADEVGGDGWEPPKPPTSSAGSPVVAGGMGGDDTSATGGTKGGGGGTKGGAGGRGGKGGSAGTGLIIDDQGGMGGQEPTGSVCGNNVVEAGEECDDGNTTSFDGCSADCKKNCETCERTYCTAMRTGPIGPNAEGVGLAPGDLVDAVLKLGLKPDGSGEYYTVGTGPDSDVPLNAEALGMVDCIRREQCWQFVPDDSGDKILSTFKRCLCDRDLLTDKNWIGHCQTMPPDKPEDRDPNTQYYVPGKCSREIWGTTGAQSLGQAMAANPNNPSTAYGAATTLLVACDRTLCREECFPADSQGAIAQISEDILVAQNAAGESPLGDLIADAQRSSMAADVAVVHDEAWSSDFTTFGFTYKASPGRAADADGRLLESEVYQVLNGISSGTKGYAPFNSTASGTQLGTIAMTGDQIYKVLEAYWGNIQVSGVVVTWDAAAPPGSKIVGVKKDGSALDKNATYSVACNDYFARKILGKPTGEVFPGADKHPQAELIAYLKAQTGPIASPTLNRFIRLN